MGFKILDDPPDPDIIADPGFRYPLEGFSEAQQNKIKRDRLKSFPPAIRKVVEQDLKDRGVI